MQTHFLHSSHRSYHITNFCVYALFFQIRMLIYEGLQTSFTQQAVIIDPDEGSYIPLGKVKKSMVVVPDIDSAFAPDQP